jgi:hypothetical protein
VAVGMLTELTPQLLGHSVRPHFFASSSAGLVASGLVEQT